MSPNLSAPHYHELSVDSAIAPEQIAEYGFATVGKREAEAYGFKGVQRKAGLLVPFQDVHGTEHYQLKPDEPRSNRQGKPIKYETPRGSTPVIAMSARSRKHIGNPAKTLWITEGIKKMASAESHGIECIIGLQGVYNWRGRNQHDGLTALPDWEYIALNERLVVLAFDSDVATNKNVQRALTRLKSFLENKGAMTKVLVMPDLPETEGLV